MKKRQWRLGCLTVIVLLFVLPAVKTVLLTRPAIPVSLPSLPAGKESYTVGVVLYKFHSAILVEQPAGWKLGPPGTEDGHFLEYGWGDRQFYGNEDHSIGAILIATFWGTPSVSYLERWDHFPDKERDFRATYTRTVTAEQLGRLLRSLEESMERTPEGKRPQPFPTLRKKGRFYPARENYIFWYDCNQWTVDQLSSVGLASKGGGVITVDQIPSRLQGFHEVR